jgi:hypothetical protein
MANRQAIEAAFQKADARLDQLHPMMKTYETDKLLDDGGKWSVRDCLSHVAASARVSAMGQRAYDRLKAPPAPAAAPAAPATPPMSIDDRTALQVSERKDKSVAQLVDEAKQAHVASMQDIRAMDDATLDTKVPDFQPGRQPLSVGGLILRMLEYHEGRQVDRIEDALKVRTRWV